MWYIISNKGWLIRVDSEIVGIPRENSQGRSTGEYLGDIYNLICE